MKFVFLAFLLLMHKPATAQLPADPQAGVDAPPAVGPWKSIDPMLVGPASKLFSRDLPFVAPMHTHKLPPELQRLRAISVCPDGTGVLIFAVLDGSDALVKVNAETGAIVGEPTKFGRSFRRFTYCRAGSSSLLVRNAPTEITQVDANSGQIVRKFSVDAEALNFCGASDGTAFAIDTPTGIEIWDLADGKSRGIVRPEGADSDRLVPVAFPGAAAILACHMKGETANFVAFDPLSRRKLAGSELTMGPFAPSSDQTCMLIASIASNKWEKVTLWNTKSLEKAGESTLEPSLAAISQKLGPGGRLVFLQEYMVQPILVFDTKKNAFVAAFGPDGYGSAMFDISPDGSGAASIVGPWINGDLNPGWIATYDLKSLGG